MLKGELKGKFEAAIEIAKRLLQKGISVSDISDTTGLDEELVEQLELSSNESALIS